MTLRIVHLFPSELGLFGDIGNVTALTKRAQWSGIEVSVASIALGDHISTDADVYVIGSGSTAGIRAVGAQIDGVRTALVAAHSKGATVVAIGAGLHLMTNRVDMVDGMHVDGVGLVNAVCTPRQSRLVGGVFTDGAISDVAGFVNTGHEISGEVTPLITALSGLGIDSDGVLAERFLGTHFHGPFLTMNPRFADEIILRHTGKTVDLDEPRVARATHAAEKSRESLRRELGA